MYVLFISFIFTTILFISMRAVALELTNKNKNKKEEELNKKEILKLNLKLEELKKS